jgi:prepilin-type N-terminal cleavage/methylation domain-containing protein
MTSRRQGFTLAEIVVSLVIAGIIGASFTKLLVSQNRYFDHETNLRSARSIARSATNLMIADLRMVQDSGGVDSVTADGKLIRILVPYRFGLVCGTNGNTTTVSMLPTDSGTVALSVYRGFAWRDSATGRYHYISPANPTTSDRPAATANAALCTGNGAGQAQIQTVSVNGRTGDLLDLSNQAPSGARVATPVFLWQHITYSFRTSGIYPNRLALWRDVEGGRNEELMAPFDTSARFMFYADGDDAARVVPPAVSAIRGVDLVLSALSPRGMSNDSTRLQSRVVTSVFFKNVRRF